MHIVELKSFHTAEVQSSFFDDAAAELLIFELKLTCDRFSRATHHYLLSSYSDSHSNVAYRHQRSCSNTAVSVQTVQHITSENQQREPLFTHADDTRPVQKLLSVCVLSLVPLLVSLSVVCISCVERLKQKRTADLTRSLRKIFRRTVNIRKFSFWTEISCNTSVPC